jgi:sterol desaturase/sphingolipid hydroxylase (fatty acid hydroxylase superfamily)
MDDLKFGTRDKRGNWTPNQPLEIAPFWIGKWNKVGRWIIAYLWPHNTIFMAVTLAYWYFILPDWEVMRTFSWDWVLWIHIVNSLGVFLLFGAVEFFYFVRRKQGTRFKYNSKFPSENPSDVFWFKSQNIDNFLRSFFVTLPIWTLIECFTLWCFANGFSNAVDPSEHWLWLAILILLAPAIHEVHFYCGHWLIHQPPLYKWIHSIHHNSINPSPWSSLSMHPVEGAFFISEMMWHLLLPSAPFVAMFQLTSTAFGAIVGHIGFDKLEVTEGTAMDSHAYTHYLHHKYFEVNYGGDGLIPLDKWFGTWHDGTKEADEQMKERFRKKKERLAHKAGKGATPAE